MGAYLPGKRVVAVGGGKGGVGKSLVTANLATSFARLGLRVIVFDADLNAPNLHTMFGIERPQRTLENFLDGECQTLVEVMLESGVPGLKLICGSPQATLGGLARGADAKRRLIKGLAKLDTDVLMIDVGAGLDHTSLDFFNAGDLRLLVLTPEITSLQNGYSFLKMAMFRRLQRFVAHHPAGERLLGGRAFEIGSSMSKLSTFLEVVDGEAPELSKPIRLLTAEYSVGLVGNMLLKQDDRNVMHAVQRMNQQFLDLDTEVIACFRTNPKIRASINQGKPFALGSSSDYDVAEYSRLARRVLGVDLDKLRKMRTQIVDALAKTSVPVAFGFEGIDIPVEEDGPSGVYMPGPVSDPSGMAAAAAVVESDPEAEEFIEEISRVSRSGIRVDGPTYVELNVGGHWHLGSLVELSTTRACLTGIHTGGSLQKEPTAMRLVNLRGARHDDDEDESSQVPVKLHRYDAASGRLTLELVDPTSARLLMTLCRGAVPHSAAV